ATTRQAPETWVDGGHTGPRRDRGSSGPPSARTHPAARSSRAGQGGPARDRRAHAWAPPRPAGAIPGWLAEPVPARLEGEHGRGAGGTALPPGAPGGG